MDSLADSVDWRDHITVDPEICHGRACITGTRIPVTTVLNNLAAGLDSQAIAESYPSVTPDAVRAAMCYAAELAKEHAPAGTRTKRRDRARHHTEPPTSFVDPLSGPDRSRDADGENLTHGDVAATPHAGGEGGGGVHHAGPSGNPARGGERPGPSGRDAHRASDSPGSGVACAVGKAGGMASEDAARGFPQPSSQLSGHGARVPMEVRQDPFLDLHARLTTLGCDKPTTLSLLPLNLDTASSAHDLVFPTSAATVHTLLRQAGLSYDVILSPDVSPRYKLDRANDLILPGLFVAVTWLHENRAALKNAMDMLVVYLRGRLTRSDQTHQVCFEVVHENPSPHFSHSGRVTS